MNKIFKRILTVFMVIISLTMLGGCWDSKEFNELFVITATALDVAEDPKKITVTLQTANIPQGAGPSGGNSSGGSGSGGKSGSSSKAVIILKAESQSLLDGIMHISRDSNREVLFQHNQIRIIGKELAQKGIIKHLDMLMRDTHSRLEVPLAVVDGRAEEVVKAKLSQDPNSGIFLGEMFRDLSRVSNEYQVRLIDFAQMLIGESVAPIMPMIKLSGSDDKQEIHFVGMAVFKDDKMIGSIDTEETLGLIWAFGNVKNTNMDVKEEEQNHAVLRIKSFKTKPEVSLEKNGKVKINLDIDVLTGLGELKGFKEYKMEQLIEHVKKLAEERIKDRINDTLLVAKQMKSDFFRFGTLISQKHPKEWKRLKKRWENELFMQVELNVNAKVKIAGSGEIVQSLEKEEKK